MSEKDEMLLKLLDELIRSWSENYTPAEIRTDLEKIRLLNQARALVGEPSPSVQQFYREVFLRDVWSGVGRQSG